MLELLNGVEVLAVLEQRVSRLEQQLCERRRVVRGLSALQNVERELRCGSRVGGRQLGFDQPELARDVGLFGLGVDPKKSGLWPVIWAIASSLFSGTRRVPAAYAYIVGVATPSLAPNSLSVIPALFAARQICRPTKRSCLDLDMQHFQTIQKSIRTRF